MQKIVIDTNFLLVPFQFKVDVFREAERVVERHSDFVVLAPTVSELKLIASRRDKEARAAKFALALIERKKVHVAKATGKADEAIVDYAEREKAIVLTNDQELRRILRKKGVRVVGLREKSHLSFI